MSIEHEPIEFTLSRCNVPGCGALIRYQEGHWDHVPPDLMALDPIAYLDTYEYEQDMGIDHLAEPDDGVRKVHVNEAVIVSLADVISHDEAWLLSWLDEETAPSSDGEWVPGPLECPSYALIGVDVAHQCVGLRVTGIRRIRRDV